MKGSGQNQIIRALLALVAVIVLVSSAYAVSTLQVDIVSIVLGMVIAFALGFLLATLLLRQKNLRNLQKADQKLREAVEQKKASEEEKLRLVAQCSADEVYQEELLSRADLDEITGSDNKRAFIRHTRKILDENPGVSFTVVQIDLDRFKIFNDLFGIQEGDKLLRRIARILKRILGSNATYGHLAADHFAFCCRTDELDMEQVVAIAQRFRNAHNSHFDLNFRFGAYVIDSPSMDVQLMTDRALLALRKTKNSHHQRYAYYDDTLRKNLILEQEIIGDMTNALEKGQFEIYFQPQYNYSTGEIIGAEALARWNHPTKGLISPGVFIPIFEKNGFISVLDEYIWTCSCQYMRKWLDSSDQLIPVPISINISRLDICNPNLCGILKGLVEKYGLPFSFLKLEITESAYVDNPVQLIEVVRHLQDVGFTVEMDDFGSGYSSLNTLKDVPVDVLKLDMRFLDGENNDRGGNILSSVVRMAQWLNLPIIAEGVETKQQADYLKSIGCKYMQGFYFAKPTPSGEFEALLQDSKLGSANKAQSDTKQMDFNELWSPQSQLAHIFNDYLGAAGIFEYVDGHLEALRLNNNFFKRLGTTEEEYEPYRKNIFARFYEEEKQKYIKMLELAIATGEEVTFEMRSKPFREGGDHFWTCTRVRMISQNDQRYLFYIAVENAMEKQTLAEQAEDAQCERVGVF